MFAACRRSRRHLNPAVLLLSLVFIGVAAGDADVSTEVALYDGVAAEIDLPLPDHQRNTGGTDGAGLCVFASLQMAARWESIPELMDLFEFMKTQPGGGYPEKVRKVLDARAPKLKAGAGWVQYEGTDPAILDKAIRTGRPACVTYGYGDWYKGKVKDDGNGKPLIYHMVLLAHIDPARAAIIDNNNPGVWTWMSRDEFLARWKYPSSKGWAVVLLDAPPPPVPKN